MVSKVFEKLVNNRIVVHLEECGLFFDFQYGFRSSRSTADLLTDLLSANRLCSGCHRHLSKLVANCRNKKVGKSRKEINNILYYLLTIFLIIKVKVGLKLHLLFISCKLSV